MVFIHQAFKDEIKTLMRPDLQVKFNLKNVDDLPNETIIQRFKSIYESDNAAINMHKLRSDNWADKFIFSILDDLKSIDDQFLWTSEWLFRWTWLIDQMNTTFEAENNENELFKPGKVCRVCSADKLRNLNLSNLRDYIGKHYEVIGYQSTCIANADAYINDLSGNFWPTSRKKVYVKDWFGNYYRIPQVILVKTSIKDLVKHERQRMLERIIDQIRDSAKYDIELLTDVYQDSLRTFMEASKKLEEKLSEDVTTQAERILDIQIHTKEVLERNIQVANVIYVAWKELIVDTVPLFHESIPIGRYQIKLNLQSWNLRVFNLDIASTETYQHPHIQKNGDCCLWEWMNPLRESYSKCDYVTFVGWIISYLEHLNERSVYISMDEWQHDHYNRFKYSIEKVEKNKNQQPELSPESKDANIDDAVNDQFAVEDLTHIYDWPEFNMDDIVKLNDTITIGDQVYPVGLVWKIITMFRPYDSWIYNVEFHWYNWFIEVNEQILSRL